MRRDVFQAIADPARREILELIATNVLTVNQVAENFNVSRQAVSKQLRILKECGLLKVDKKGREKYYSIDPKSFIPAYLWIEKLQAQWEQRIDSFEEYLVKLKKENHDK